MGNKTSNNSDFVCPEDYHPDKFQKIVKIYKCIDEKGGNFIKKEKINNNHAFNELAFGEYLMEVDALENLKNEKERLHHDILNEIQIKAEEQLKINMKKEFQRHRAEMLKLEVEKEKLIESNDEEKMEKVKQKISSNKNGFSFQEFFNYMKERITNFEVLF